MNWECEFPQSNFGRIISTNTLFVTSDKYTLLCFVDRNSLVFSVFRAEQYFPTKLVNVLMGLKQIQTKASSSYSEKFVSENWTKWRSDFLEEWHKSELKILHTRVQYCNIVQIIRALVYWALYPEMFLGKCSFTALQRLDESACQNSVGQRLKEISIEEWT